MNRKVADWPTWVLSIATGAALLVVVWLLWGAGLFRSQGDYPNLEDLEHIGAFIGGVFTPLAVGWAARSFLLQRQQMLETLNEMRKQNSLEMEALEQTKEQFRIDRQKELENSDPKLQIMQNGQTSSPQAGAAFKFKIRNQGAPAQAMSISHVIRDSTTNQEISVGPSRDLRPLGTNEAVEYAIVFTGAQQAALTDRSTVKHGHEASIVICAQRLDGQVSRYTFTSTNLIDVKLANTECAVAGLKML